MRGRILAITKKSFCLSLLVLVSFVMSLPRAQEAPGPRASSIALSGHFLRVSSSWRPVSAPKSGPDGLDMRLLKVRKFRRRRTAPGFTSHLQVSYHQPPSLNDAGPFMPAMTLLLNRDPDPLVHPPA